MMLSRVLLCLVVVASVILPSKAACPYSFENGVCRGHDIWSGKLTFAQCRAKCTSLADCKSFQYRRPTCWLQNFACSKSQLSNRGQAGYAEYTKNCRDSGCGSPRQQTGFSGTFSSLNHPSTYNHNANCTWIITVTRHSRIRIQFSSLFEIESHTSCTWDSVNLYEKDSPSTLIGKFCNGKPSDRISQDNDMVVVFKSDGSVIGRGFSLTWTAIPPTWSRCGSRYRMIGRTGFVTSMNYPNNYQNNADCVWRISVPSGMRVRLHFEGKFEIEQGDEQGCSFDSVVVRGIDTNTGEFGQTYGIFCGFSAPNTAIVTDDRDIAVFFKSDSTANYAGFSLKWDAIIYTCGFLANPQNGRVSLSDQDKVHSKATYSCNTGYKLVGSNRQCQASGRWKGDSPRCEPNQQV